MAQPEGTHVSPKLFEHATDKFGELTKKRVDSISTTGSKVLKGSIALIKNPQFQTISLSTAGGAVVISTVGGAFGCMTGVVIGAGTGVLPALITFGLSVPIGGVLGGGLGAVTGMMVGAVTGAAAGGTTGFTTYRYRAEIKDGVLYVKTKVSKGALYTKDTVTTTAMNMRGAVEKTARDADIARKQLVDNSVSNVKNMSALVGTSIFKTKEAVVAAVLDRECQKTACCAVSGAFALGSAGGAAGTVTGATLGMAAGVIPALFTFGLSIPAGAVIGGGMGMAFGGAAGSTAGFAAGGASFAYRQEISSGTSRIYGNACDSLSAVKSRARALVCSTGGTSA